MHQVITTAGQIGQILRSARRARKLSQSDAAARLGFSQSRLSALELDPKVISAEQLLALLSLYGLELVIHPKSPPPEASTTEW
ncbi:helix-turn-helix domain-containing protein [Cupriavidus agavae]|uniref:HTH-type transcriptional regulator/antitoxin HipB n=1 Tax=Cupriavidus agavae TaxID=1001822 RepID=A0A4Q7SA09_9BURK|nr:helix-turn-helix transcriptional regulator [Cupriavidus agavae]RZT42620.1 HTH-type transcriptional regulator/antitoxin HipB [Cupriavidus agavae]